MKDAKPFSVFDSPIDSRMLIEASAGTGKTYNITGVFIRLLIEQKATLEQILVVTFTRMAIKELKERVLNLLRKVLRAIETGKSFDDPFLEGILNSKLQREKASAIIRDAIRNFDDARIYTIHGFSQQVLREESLTAGVPFDNEVIQTDDLMREAADDFWRDFISKNSDSDQGRYLIDRLMNFGSGPEELLDVLMPAIQYDDAKIEGAGDFDPYSVSERLIQLREELRDVWSDQKEEIVRLLIESDVKYMTEKNVQARAAAMDTFLVQFGFAQDTFDKLRFFRPSYFSENLKKNKNRVPKHRFFGLCENYAAEEGNMAKVSTWLLEHASRSIIRLRHEKSRESEIMTYDDLLDRLLEALSDEGQGEALSAKLRKKYPFALVDEFQDTDPLQYRIFEKIYPLKNKETSLMMIGDPKQAIYAFRGADLYAYIRAREDILPDSRYTLSKNFRSTPDLIQAVNFLFSPDHNSPFLDKEISYHSIEPGNTDNPGSLMIDGRRRAPLRIYCIQGINSKSDIRHQILKETAFQVATLIQQGMEGKAIIHDGKQSGELVSGDIAVLVHSHKEAETVKEFLRTLNVRSATYSREKVFESREAERVELLLTAALDPLSGSSPVLRQYQDFLGTDYLK
jgi:exodeoxyribonuclease V beta subunit